MTTWRYVRALAAPILLWTLFAAALAEPLGSWLRGEDRYDEATLREWVEEARVFRETLPEMVRDYLDAIDRARTDDPTLDPSLDPTLNFRAAKIQEHLQALGIPPTKVYPNQLPLFPLVYRLEVRFRTSAPPPAIDWDSQVPRHRSQYHELVVPLHSRAEVLVQYQLHAYSKRQHIEQMGAARLRWLSILAVAATALSLMWIYAVQRREHARERQQVEASRQIEQAERALLEEELRRREAEQRHEETERKLLEQQLQLQAAERQALELKSQLYAGIGIMAGSYAHNIKNLLVRPNDLLRRCIEADSVPAEQGHMLQEVRQTLGTVTERLQQILRTVRRDPSRAEVTSLDLNAVARDLLQTWRELAAEKWKLDLTLDLTPEPLPVRGDLSHLQQAAENLLFNARDATFEMRGRLREEARRPGADPGVVKQALLAAAGWRGTVALRTERRQGRSVLEVRDNGIGMTEEVKRRCVETHFSTKRDNAIYEGINTGMGLGLSFVVAILQHHGAELEVDSAPREGAVFRLVFPTTA